MFSLIGEYNDMFTSSQCQVGHTSWVNFRIELNKTAQPVKQTVCQLTPPLKAHLKFQLDDWLRDSVIEPADSPWASRLVPVKKKNGQVR